MTQISQMRRHATLVDRMATTLGHDLEEAVMRGRLDPAEIPEMVLRCTGCAHPDRCESWLERHAPASATPAAAKPDVRPASPPYFCRNAGVFDDFDRP